MLLNVVLPLLKYQPYLQWAVSLIYESLCDVFLFHLQKVERPALVSSCVWGSGSPWRRRLFPMPAPPCSSMPSRARNTSTGLLCHRRGKYLSCTLHSPSAGWILIQAEVFAEMRKRKTATTLISETVLICIVCQVRLPIFSVLPLIDSKWINNSFTLEWSRHIYIIFVRCNSESQPKEYK